VRFGIAFQTNKRAAQYAALARQVDALGFDVVSAYNDLFYQPAIGPLLLMAPHLRTAQLGPAVVNPYTVQPLELAGQLAVLDDLTGGRAYLGLGRGAWLEQIGLTSPRPVTALREAIEIVQRLWRGDTAGFAGQVFSLAAGARLQFDLTRPAIPIVIGTWGPRTAHLAGEVATEVKIGASANPAMVRHLRPAIDAGSLAAGRAPGSVGICVGTPTVIDADRAAARQLARRILAPYLPIVAGLDPTQDDPEWLAHIQSLAARGDYVAVAAATSDAQLERFAFAGDAADLLRQVEALAAAGATRVEFGNPHGLDEPAGVALLGEVIRAAG
jgi:5,10-methylenetetrahydromethanopterin reductase